MKNILFLLIIISMGLTACSKGPSKSTMKELMVDGELLTLREQKSFLSVQDFTVNETLYKSEKTPVGLVEQYKTTLNVVMKTQKDCELSTQYKKGVVPYCRPLEEISQEKNKKISEIKEMKQECKFTTSFVPGAGCSVMKEERRQKLIEKVEKEYSIDENLIWKSGMEKTFKAGVIFVKDGSTETSKWKIYDSGPI